MAQLALAAAGAVVGSFFGAPQIGFAIGAALGGSLFPEKVKGPRLEDLKSNQYEYGTPVPHLYGHARVPGVVAWSSDKQEVSQTSGGKGGPEVTSYTYKQDVLYVLSANECAGVRRIWSNGKLVWSAADDATDSTIEASADTDSWEEIEFFTGAEDQLPWSVYEAAVGVENAPAMRGRFSVGITGLNLGSSGFPPNLTFELVHTGDAGEATTRVQTGFADGEPDDIAAFSIPYVLDVDSPNTVVLGDGVATFETVEGAGAAAIYYQSPYLVPDETRGLLIEGFMEFLSSSDALNFIPVISYFPAAGSESGRLEIGYGGVTGWGRFETESFGSEWSGFPAPLSGRVHFAIQATVSGGTKVYIAGQEVYSNAVNSGAYDSGASQGSLVIGSQVTAAGDYSYRVTDVAVRFQEKYLDEFAPPEDLDPPDGGTITANADPLDEVLEDLCVRSGLDLSYVDASACSALLVDSLAVSQVTPARQVIETLMAAKNVTVVEGDKLKFVLRGGAAITGPTYDELGATEGDPEGERLPITIRSDIEIPAQVAVTYANLLDDYQAGTEYSDRLIGGARGVTTVQLPLGLNPQEAKRIADVRLHDGALAATSIGPVGLTAEWSHLEPTDVIPLVDQSGSTFRTRIEKITDGGGVRTLEVVLDDASVITSVALTDVTDNNSTVVRRVEDTELVPIDSPIFRDVDDGPGHYVAVSPVSSEGTWPGAVLYRDNENLMTITDRTVIGTATTTLGDFAGGYRFDEQNTLTVSVNGVLQSYTRDAILEGTAAPYLVGSEVIYARTATLVSPGVYTLSGLLRGRRGTEWAIPDHTAGETVVRIQTNGFRRVDMSTAQLGVEYDYRAVTNGRAVANAESHLFTNTGIGLMPFAPVDLRAATGTDTVFTWKRRPRLETRLLGSAGISCPLGETEEAYEVEIYASSAFDVVKRTISTTAATATYTASQQVLDFGSVQTTFYVRVYQMSEAIGRGYPLEATINAAEGTEGAPTVESVRLSLTFEGNDASDDTGVHSPVLRGDAAVTSADAYEGTYSLNVSGSGCVQIPQISRSLMPGASDFSYRGAFKIDSYTDKGFIFAYGNTPSDVNTAPTLAMSVNNVYPGQVFVSGVFAGEEDGAMGYTVVLGGTPATSPDGWYSFEVRRTGETFALYVNDVLIESETIPGPGGLHLGLWTLRDEPLNVGGFYNVNSSAVGNGMDGYVDSFIVEFE